MTTPVFAPPVFGQAFRRKSLCVAPVLPFILRSGSENRVTKDGRRSRWRHFPTAALAGLLLLSACGQKSIAEAAPPAGPLTENSSGEAPAPAPSGSGPAMWLVSDEDSDIYLFGTFHLLPATLQWTTPAFDEAMERTATTMTEVDTKSPAAQAKMTALVRQLGLNPPGVTLSSTLGPERAARLGELAVKYDVPIETLEPLKPWLAMIGLSVTIMQKEGFDADSGAEATILGRAATEGDGVAYLESAEYQIRALASLDEKEIIGDFDSSLDQLGDFDAYARRVVNAWRSGDVGALEEETLAPMRDMAPGAFRTLITDRNRNWVAEIDEILAGEGDYFIAVGAGHLIGEGSVVDMLEEKGYAVRRVQ